MPATNLQNILEGQDKRRQLIFGDGELKKASLKYNSTKYNKQVLIPVQFNPTEYSISRHVKYKKGEGIGKDSSPKKMQSTGSNLAQLSVKLILDTSTELPDYVVKAELKKYIDSDNELADICQDLSMLTKIYPDTHTQSQITFSWGSLEFVGFLSSLNINYQMFNRNGRPVRAELNLTIEGEEKDILTVTGSKPLESPDRTKYRLLNQKDELWMLADEEYQDTSCWKDIARANGILNPRKIDYTKRLKVPSL